MRLAKLISSLSPSNAALRRLLDRNPGFFDEAWYEAANPDVAASGLGARDHYLASGAAEGRRPNPIFDTAWYAGQLSPQEGAENTALHYLRVGSRHGLKPCYLFDPAFYYERNSEVEQSGEEALSHYLRAGWQEGRDPHPFFSVRFYLEKYPDIAHAGAEPLAHFLNCGAAEDRRPNVLFSPAAQAKAMKGLSPAEATMEFVTTSSPEALLVFNETETIRAIGQAGTVRDWCERHGGHIEAFDRPDISWTGYRIANAPASTTKLRASLPPPYVAMLENVTCFSGTRLLLSPAGDILHDELAEDTERRYLHKLSTIASVDNGTCTILAALWPEVLDEVIVISSDTEFNYFHMLVETLPKMALIEKLDIPQQVPVLIQDGLHANLVAAAQRILGGHPMIRIPAGRAVKARRLWYVSDLSRVLDNRLWPVDHANDIVISPEAVRFISQRLPSRPAAGPATRKLYLARASTHRLLENEPKLIAELERRGFEILETGGMNLDQQIETFRQARYIIGPTGAAITNLLWCQPGTRVLVMVADNPQGNHNIFNQLGEPLGVEVEFVLCQRLFNRTGLLSVNDDFEADIAEVSRWCEAMDLKPAMAEAGA